MVKKSKKTNTVRVILNVPIELNENIEKLAVKRGLCKSQMILFCMGYYLDYAKTLDNLPGLIQAVNKIND